MRWTWDDRKNRANELKHGLDFETAKLVFDDPFAVSRPDLYPDEERWQTIGVVERVILIVVHTWPVSEPDSDEEVGRIISARKATKHERRAYEKRNF
ncbi:BrnT family toxin [Gloeocapsa sp. PCC 73106]|uniref:BrnT family toxin n=1 Tax=Gloeocapsa sp. PCC 73106 TaxID=102232 RepID=UPI0002ABB1DA|nr:BrnT family toxin [Gloeocapsa sp. PCC 73106]ELR99732.1 hypothetical protein GLO73106DRAFT_00035840 [Gloeocapsa sp. PCC 73106]